MSHLIAGSTYRFLGADVTDPGDMPLADLSRSLSRDEAFGNHLEKCRPCLRWRIGLPITASVKVFQFPGRPVFERLFEAVCGTNNGTGRDRLRPARSDEENSPVDDAVSMSHHACHQSSRLKPSEPLFGSPSVQT